MLCPICRNESRRFGFARSGSQRYRCDACAKTFTDESTRVFDRRRVDPAKMNLVKMTPAQKSGLTVETWSLQRLLAEAAKV